VFISAGGDLGLTWGVGTLFRFNCFNVEDQDEAPVGLLKGELAIPGALLRSEAGSSPVLFSSVKW
jgi:hypothetical protein